MGLDFPDVSTKPTRLPFNFEMANLVAEINPDVVSFHFGLPRKELLEVVHKSGAKIISSEKTVEEAIWLEKNGVYAIIAQGLEAGGHRGMFLNNDIEHQSGTFLLVPNIVNKVSIPVIAAGGIVDARSVRAAINLGASAVQVGTAFLLSDEAKTTLLHREAIKSSANNFTAITNVFTGRPARGLMNRLMRELGPISALAPNFPLASTISSSLRAKAESLGIVDFTPLWAGQRLNGCKEVPAAEIVSELLACFDFCR